MTTQQRKMAVQVAKDVIKHLETKKIKATTGTYFTINGDLELGPLQQSLKKLNKPCEACALGACFISQVVRYNKFNLTEFNRYVSLDDKVEDTYISDLAMRPKLDEIFSESQRTLIESAFEKTLMGDSEDTNLFDEGNYELAEKAIKFGKRYKSDRGRLIAIMNNIIENKGEFVP